MDGAFSWLRENYAERTAGVSALVEYVDTYLLNVWNKINISAYMSPIITNNDVEGWYR